MSDIVENSKHRVIGHSFLSKREFATQMADYSASGGWANGEPLIPPTMATPVYEDDSGNRWTEMPTTDGIFQRPFETPVHPWAEEQPRDPARRFTFDPLVAMDKGGFAPAFDGGADATPTYGADGDEDLASLMGGMASQLPPEAALSWLGDTATRAMTAAAPGGMLDTTMQALGLTNPMAQGPLGDALGAALQSAGLGDVAGGMLGTLMNRGASGLASQLGSNVVNQALAMAGLGDLPGMGALSGLAGGALGNLAGGALDDIAGGVVGDLLKNGASGAAASLLGGLGGGAGGLADLMTTGGFAGPLGDATGAFDDIMGGCFPGGDSNMADLSELTSGGCFDPNAGAGLDLNALGSKGLDKAVDHMMSEWKVDDESSAAEHIAHKMVSENLADLKSLAKDELLGGKGGGLAGLVKKIKKFFAGEAPGTGQPAIRMGDLDDQANLCITGIANIKFEGQEVARRTDTVAGPTAPAPKPIVIGEPTVISAGMENAFVLAPTAVPSKMAAKGATTILVGGAVVAALQEAAKKEAEAKANAAPKAPAGPKSTNSDSESDGQEGEGKKSEGEAGSETAAGAKGQSESTPGADGESKATEDATDEEQSDSGANLEETSGQDADEEGSGTEESADGMTEEEAAELKRELDELNEKDRDTSDPSDEERAAELIRQQLEKHKGDVMKAHEEIMSMRRQNQTNSDDKALIYAHYWLKGRGMEESPLLSPGAAKALGEAYDLDKKYLNGWAFYILFGKPSKNSPSPHDPQTDRWFEKGVDNEMPSKDGKFKPDPPRAPRRPASTGYPSRMDPKDAPPGTLEQPGQINSPPVGGFTVDPNTGKITRG